MDPSFPLTHHSSSWPLPKLRWAINLEGKVIEILKIVIVKIRANPTHVIGWFNNKLRKAWKLIFPTNRGEYKDRPSFPHESDLGLDAKPMVAVLGRQIIFGGRKENSLANDPIDLSDSDLIQYELKRIIIQRRMLEIQPIPLP